MRAQVCIPITNTAGVDLGSRLLVLDAARTRAAADRDIEYARYVDARQVDRHPDRLTARTVAYLDALLLRMGAVRRGPWRPHPDVAWYWVAPVTDSPAAVAEYRRSLEPDAEDRPRSVAYVCAECGKAIAARRGIGPHVGYHRRLEREAAAAAAAAAAEAASAEAVS